MWMNLFKLGGYACATREIIRLLDNSKVEQELKRSRHLNIALGIALGAYVGMSLGMLVALKGGKQSEENKGNEQGNV